VTAIALVLVAVMTAPTITRPASVARMDSNDALHSIWNVAWVAHALVDEPSQLYHGNIFHPHRYTLAYSEANLAAGLLAAPAYAVTRHPVAAYNVSIYAALTIGFVLTWWVGRRLVDHWAPPLVGACGYTFSSFVSAHTAHIQLLMIFAVPLGLWGLHRFVESPGWRRGIGLGLCLAGAGLSCAYYGIMTGLAIGVGALWFAPWQPRPLRYWTGLLVALVVAGAAVAPAFAPFLQLRSESGMRSEINLDEAAAYSADHRTYMRGHAGVLTRLLPDALHARIAAYVGRDGEVLFPGITILMLAVTGAAAALRDARRVAGAPGTAATSPVTPRRVAGFYVALVVVSVWASLGPRAGLYTWMTEIVPFMSFLRAPARFGVIVIFALGMLATLGAAAAGRADVARRVRAGAGASALAGVLLASLVTVELYARWPLREVPPVPEAYRRLAELPRGPLLALHFPYRPSDFHAHARYMFWSTWHWQPLINGYSDFIPPDFREMAVPINGFPDAESFRLLRERGARYVAIDWSTYNEVAAPLMRARFPPYQQYLKPIVQDGRVDLYEIVGWPAS
jgi:hypothetical protein